MLPSMQAKGKLPQDTLQKVITYLQNADAAGVAFQKMLSIFASERDISSQETCHILFELSLTCSSHQYQNLYISPDEASESLDFETSEKEDRGILEKQNQPPVDQKPELENVSLWEFANFEGGKYTKCGTRGAKPNIVNLWPLYQPDHDEPEIYEKYCYA